MDCINKIVSKLYAYIEGEGVNVLVAEIVKNPGCGFNYLIRIRPQYKKILNVWAECLQLCNVSVDLSDSIIEKSINDGYYYTHEEIAVIIDEVI